MIVDRTFTADFDGLEFEVDIEVDVPDDPPLGPDDDDGPTLHKIVAVSIGGWDVTNPMMIEAVSDRADEWVNDHTNEIKSEAPSED